MSKENDAIYKASKRLQLAERLFMEAAANTRETLTHLIGREIRFKRGYSREILSGGFITDLGCHSGHPVFSVQLIKKDGKAGGNLAVYPHQITEWMPKLTTTAKE